MSHTLFTPFRFATTLFVFAVVLISFTNMQYLLSVAGLMTGILFVMLVKANSKIQTDEREASVQEKAAKVTYRIFAPTLAITSLLLLLPTHSGVSVFSKGNFLFLESLGIIFAYLTLFMISLYAISFHFLNRKFGGGSEE